MQSAQGRSNAGTMGVDQMSAAAFSGDYTDLRFIKTRSVAAITIEIPIEQASAFVAAFGAPVPSSGCPVAIAKINPSVVRQQLEASVALIEKPKERRSWSALSYAEQAGIRCNEPDFWRFINEWYGPHFTPSNANEAASFVREFLDVDSRADIKVGTPHGDQWESLNGRYESWKQRPTF